MKWSFACVSLHGRKSMEAIKENWTTIKEAVRREYSLSDISYHTWVEPLEFHNVVNDVVSIIIPSDQAHALNYISSKYKSFFQVTITEMFDHPYDISFILEKDVKGEEPAENEMAAPNQIYGVNYEDAHLNPKYKFDTFVVGSNNKFAHSASLAVAESPGEVYNPLYLYGGPGLGKTHLMHSIGHFILEQDPDKKVLYVTSEEFTNEVIESIRSGNAASMTKLREKYRNVDVLMVDDVQFIIGKESTQEEFFHTFNALHAAHKQIILSSDKPPKEMETLDERFRSRFEWGLIADIQPPDYETRMAILRKNAETYDRQIDEEIIKYIATNIKSNIRELEGALNKLVALSNLEKREINISMAEEVLKDIISPNSKREVTPQVILDVVAEHYGVSSSDIIGSKRNSEIVVPRQIVMYLCREITDTSYKAIGILLGNRDHSTIISGDSKVRDKLASGDSSLKSNIDTIKKKLSAG